MKTTLPPNTLVQAIDVAPDVIGRVLRLAKDADEYGDEEYVVQWPSGLEELRPRNDLFVWPRPSVFDVRAIASEVGLSCPPEKTDEELLHWFLECLKRRYDEADEINRLLPYTSQPTLQRIQNLLASVDAAREEIKHKQARLEHYRSELEQTLERNAAETERFRAGSFVLPRGRAAAHKDAQADDIAAVLAVRGECSLRELVARVNEYRGTIGCSRLSPPTVRRVLGAHAHRFAWRRVSNGGQAGPALLWRVAGGAA